MQQQLPPPEGGRYKFKCYCKGWRSEDRRYGFNCNAPVVKIAAHSLKAVPRKLGWAIHEFNGNVKCAQLNRPLQGQRQLRLQCSGGENCGARARGC